MGIAEERLNDILEYIYLEGYTSPTRLKRDVITDRAISTVRKVFGEFRDLKLLDNTELSSKGTGGGLAHFLTDEGLKAIKKDRNQIAQYRRGLKSIPGYKMRHYFLAIDTIKLLQAFFVNEGYDVSSWNEFSDRSGLLAIKLNKSILYSDGQITLSKDGYEHFTVRIEADRSTEPIKTLISKIGGYYLYSKSQIQVKHGRTFPIPVLFILKEKRAHNTIAAILNKGYAEYPHLLFLPVERLSGSHIFYDDILLDAFGNNTSFAEILKARSPLLQLQNAFDKGIQKYKPTYDIILHHPYNTLDDTFFPFNVVKKDRDWCPDGYFRVKQKNTDALFALVCIVWNGMGDHNILRKFDAYQSYILLKRQTITATKCCGVVIIIEESDDVERVKALLENSPLRDKIRITDLASCNEGIVDGCIWFDTQSGISVPILKD